MIATASSASSSATVKEISFVPLRPTDCKIISTLMLYFASALKRWNAIPGSSFNPITAILVAFLSAATPLTSIFSMFTSSLTIVPS